MNWSKIGMCIVKILHIGSWIQNSTK